MRKPSSSSRGPVLISAAGRASLALARCLYEHKIPFICVGKKGSENLAFYSRYVKTKYEVTDPQENVESFIADLLKIIELEGVGFLFPMSDLEDTAIAKYAHEFEGIIELAYDVEVRKITMDKEYVTSLARNIGVAVPKTIPLEKFDRNGQNSLEYPIVVKPKKTCIFDEKHKVVNHLRTAFIVKDEDEMTNVLEEKNPKLYMVQEYVPGKGYGFFVLFNKHKEFIAYFMHRRIHESQGHGGSSAFSKSYYDEELKEDGLKLFTHLNYCGVGMAEFRKDKRTDEYKFLEINSRYWGSSSLAFDAGVEFPYLHYKYWDKSPEKTVTSYKNIYWRHLVGGETGWLRSTIRKKNTSLPGYNPPSTSDALKEFFTLFFHRNVHYSLEDLRDPAPAFHSCFAFLTKLLKKRIPL